MLREYTLNGATFLLSEEDAKRLGATRTEAEPKQAPGQKQVTSVKNKAIQSPQVK